MKAIIQKLDTKLDLIFISFLIYGLSFAILLKELNLLFFNFQDIGIIYIYRGLIVIFSLVIFYKMEKKFNKWIFFFLLINIIFLYNFYFGKIIIFNINSWEYFFNLNYSFDKSLDASILYSQKNKFLIINTFNVIFPLLVFVFIKRLNFEIYEFKSISSLICNSFALLLFIFLLIKYSQNLFAYSQNLPFKLNFINIHSMTYILNIHVLLFIDKFFNENEKINSTDLWISFTVFFMIILIGSLINILVISSSFLIYIFLFKKKFNYLLIFFILIILVLLLLIFNYIIVDFNLQVEKEARDYFKAPGSYYGSIRIRFYTVLYFLTEVEKFNWFFGNNIFSKNLVIYPHNFLLDILLCTGLIGLIIFFIVNIKLITIVIKKNKLFKNIFIYVIFIQSLIFSSLSGFFFVNIILNISFVAAFILSDVNEDRIIANSLG